ncbi:MAG TPA: hotdog domain-containing protein [Candidatus Lokiarchaeia archaeon]|nr:hotdog domain-containing protein [Candidatus Lokiarchaeia archaeon]
MTQEQTHLLINHALCGDLLEITDEGSKVTLTLTQDMAVDDHDLVHGGFIFGLADYAAMVAVNHPNVVLGSSSFKFLKPCVVGDNLLAEATKQDVEGKKITVALDVRRGDEVVASGEFVCFALEKHVLD